MKRKLIFSLAVLVLSLGTTALAMPHNPRTWDRDHDRDDYRRTEHRAKHHHKRHYRRYDRDDYHRPAGWDHGQKRGWGDRDMPPGLAKKQHRDWDHDRDWDRDRDEHRNFPVHTTVNRPVHRPAPVITTTTTTTTATHRQGTYEDWLKTQQQKKASGQREPKRRQACSASLSKAKKDRIFILSFSFS